MYSLWFFENLSLLVLDEKTIELLQSCGYIKTKEKFLRLSDKLNPNNKKSVQVRKLKLSIGSIPWCFLLALGSMFQKQ